MAHEALLARSPAAHLLLCSPVPNRHWSVARGLGTPAINDHSVELKKVFPMLKSTSLPESCSSRTWKRRPLPRWTLFSTISLTPQLGNGYALHLGAMPSISLSFTSRQVRGVLRTHLQSEDVGRGEGNKLKIK